MAGIDDTEAISFGIGEHHEVGVRRIRVPLHTRRAEADQTLDLGGLLGSVVDNKVEMDSWMLLGRRIRPLQRHSRSLTRGWNQDRKSVALIGEANGLVAEDA